jgi:hypothetical protein
MVLPRDDAWVRAGVAISNRWSALRSDPFRVHVHRSADVLRVATAGGLTLAADHRGRFWRTLVLERVPG